MLESGLSIAEFDIFGIVLKYTGSLLRQILMVNLYYYSCISHI